MSRPPAERASSSDVRAFLGRAKTLQRFSAGRARLIFAIDATASRQPTWDLACELQASMFSASAAVGTLAIQLAYYRGLGELHFGSWDSDTAVLAQQMSRVHCAAGRTQIARLLRAALKQQSQASARALVFIGDAVEEQSTALYDLAGKCRLQGLPLFLFQEGDDPHVTRCFSQMAKLSGGACERFDHRSAQRLADLLQAVARYAAGGRAALENSKHSADRKLLSQLSES